jgi:predicted enzyme related to lactoylglutathione lyase
MKLSAARLFVKDLVAAKRFYESVLGLPLQHDGVHHGYCVFDAGAVTLVVESVPDDAPDDEQVLVGRFSGLSFYVADIHAEHQRLRAAGVRFTGEPELQVWGGWLATFVDTSDNALQIAQMPSQVHS